MRNCQLEIRINKVIFVHENHMISRVFPELVTRNLTGFDSTERRLRSGIHIFQMNQSECYKFGLTRDVLRLKRENLKYFEVYFE